MNWKLKAHTLAVLSRLPGGRRAYHCLQRWLGTNKLDVEDYLDHGLDIVELIQAQDRVVKGGTFLEIGTGWRPFAPFILYLAGAERIITVDVNPWLTHAYAVETFRALGPRLGAIAERLGLDANEVQRRYHAARPHAGNLTDLLRAFHVEYRYPADARCTGLADQSVDFVFSSNVLEHVEPESLRAIHRESFRVLKANGLAIHRVDLKDHYCLVDPSITSVNFLQYSEKQWRWYGGSGLAYHNRLRGVQHRRMLEEAGFGILSDRMRLSARSDLRSLDAIRSGHQPIHAEYAGFSPEELAAGYMWIVGGRSCAMLTKSGEKAQTMACASLR
jgi:predicted SAM-dependent methyltransferase